MCRSTAKEQQQAPGARRGSRTGDLAVLGFREELDFAA